MGMYDHINFEDKCPDCGEKVINFQSKNGPCLMAELEFWEVNNFYSWCTKCDIWIEYTLGLRPNRKLIIKDYSRFAERTKGEGGKNNG